jgi:hypothetical protein
MKYQMQRSLARKLELMTNIECYLHANKVKPAFFHIQMKDSCVEKGNYHVKREA